MQLFLAKTGFIQKPICAERFLLSILTGNGFLCDIAQATKYRYVHQTETFITQIFKNMIDWWMVKKKVFQCTPKHYDNTPIQYTAIFHSCKKNNFQMKNCNIFLIFAQNVDCGYMLRLLQQGGSNKCP